MGRVVTWPMPLTERPFDRYGLSVNGTEVPVWTGRVREEINKPSGHGYTHMLNGKTEWCGFARFDFENEADVVVTLDQPCTQAEVLPKAYGIVPTVDGKTIRFAMKEPQHLTLLIDGNDEEPLHLLTHRPETDIPDPKDPNVLYFGPGEHWVTNFQLKSGQTVYLDGGAIVRAVMPAGAVGKQGGVLKLFSYPAVGPVLNVKGVENVRICGRGILDGTLLPHLAYNLIRLSEAKKVTIEGILLRNSPNWHIPICSSEHITVDGVACLSGRLNSDGINCVNSQHVTVRNCFVRNYDDTYAVKTNVGAETRDILYENCVAWNDWGYAFGPTYESRANISHVVYRNCHAVYARHWGIGVHISDSGAVHDIHFENISIHYPKTNIPKEMNMKLIQIDNQHDHWGHDDKRGDVHDIVIRDLTVTGENVPKINIAGADEEHSIADVLIKNVRVNGRVLSGLDDVQVAKIKHAVNVRIEP